MTSALESFLVWNMQQPEETLIMSVIKMKLNDYDR